MSFVFTILNALKFLLRKNSIVDKAIYFPRYILALASRKCVLRGTFYPDHCENIAVNFETCSEHGAQQLVLYTSLIVPI